MKISVSPFNNIKNIKSDLLTIFIFSDPELFKEELSKLEKYLPEEVKRIKNLENFNAQLETSFIIYTCKEFKTPRIQFFGLGEKEKVGYETLRKAAALTAINANKYKIKDLAIIFPKLPNTLSVDYATQAIFEGSVLSQYKFDKYITPSKENLPIKSVTIYYNKVNLESRIKKAKINSEIICESVKLARDLSNMPASELYPEVLANYAKKSAKKFNYKAEVWNEKKIKENGFGGLTAVSSGSIHPARFIILKYKGNNLKKSNIILVGKGITFDSGGISLKPADRMSEMKMDMSGAAVVLATIQAIARLKLPINLIGLIPTCENMPSGSALKPGDIIKHYGGKTSEVENTDAEGRLILADALAYAQKFNPELVIDIATLTGAVITALGHHVTAIFGNDPDTIKMLKDTGEKTYERIWELPLYDEYKKQIKSKIADIKNIGTRGAGAITAAMFLKNFISDKKGKEFKWIHLDIAGTAILNEASYYLPEGATGVGVRLLTEFLMSNFT